jgi:hypothetical protein
MRSTTTMTTTTRRTTETTTEPPTSVSEGPSPCGPADPSFGSGGARTVWLAFARGNGGCWLADAPDSRGPGLAAPDRAAGRSLSLAPSTRGPGAYAPGVARRVADVAKVRCRLHNRAHAGAHHGVVVEDCDAQGRHAAAPVAESTGRSGRASRPATTEATAPVTATAISTRVTVLPVAANVSENRKPM